LLPCLFLNPVEDCLHGHRISGSAMLNGLDDAFLRMMLEEQQDTDELAFAGMNAMGFRENPAQA